jgi:hypothetical protein
LTKNSEKIKDLKKHIAKLQAEDSAFNALTPDQQTAITLHEMLCMHNHTDGCGWYYEMKHGKLGKQIDDWTGREHGVYMQKALMLRSHCHLHGLTTETAIDLFKLIRGY